LFGRRRGTFRNLSDRRGQSMRADEKEREHEEHAGPCTHFSSMEFAERIIPRRVFVGYYLNFS
jgi:hypothetical protein